MGFIRVAVVVVMDMGMAVIMCVIMPMMMGMIDAIILKRQDTVCKHHGAENEHDQAGDDPQPGVEFFRIHMAGRQGCRQTQDENTEGVGDGNGEPEV